jgi:hypothetical protein
MKNKVLSLIKNYRRRHPHARRWTDEQVIGALLQAASRVLGSRVQVIGQNDDGELLFQIDLRPPDGSDGS